MKKLKEKCTKCSGTGKVWNKDHKFNQVKCGICKGYGSGCKTCHGTGKVFESCSRCSGSGWVKKRKGKSTIQIRGRRR